MSPVSETDVTGHHTAQKPKVKGKAVSKLVFDMKLWQDKSHNKRAASVAEAIALHYAH